MGTRSGSLDPTVVTYIMKKEGKTPDEVESLLNKQSGLMGLSGISSDCRDISAAAEAGNERAKLALKVLIHYIKKIIGSYVAEMNGVDALVFTAGIGENHRYIRREVCREMSYLGIAINEDVNDTAPSGEDVELTAEGAGVRTFVLPTNEEYMIALDTLNLSK